jgi:hypothetical protein
VAIEPSRQFKDSALKRRLEAAQILKLEADAAKTRQEIFESVQNMYGVTKKQPS